MEFPRHRSRASPRRLARRALRPRAREVRAWDQRLRKNSNRTREITLVAYHRLRTRAHCRHRAIRTRLDARRANERGTRDDARVDPFGPRRASREETTVERAREDNAERF